MLTRIALKSPQQRNFLQKEPRASSEALCVTYPHSMKRPVAITGESRATLPLSDCGRVADHLDRIKAGLGEAGPEGTCAWHSYLESLEGELWPVQHRTPRYALNGPTFSRYWWAMTLEIWCR
jgi:hypothetical protein